MGTLYYVVGASGSGKDTLMNYARNHITQNDNCIFAHRYITRPVDLTGENHIALSKEAFAFRKEHNLFALDWFSHETFYAIGKEIDIWLNKGINVVMNGSRGYLKTAIERYPEMQVVLIEVDSELLRNRLNNRGRESMEQIEKRIQRANEFADFKAPNLFRFQNNEDISITGPAFKELVSTKTMVTSGN